MRIVSIVGTRPQYIKLAPIYHALKKFSDVELVIIDTGQHYDDEMSKFILENLEIEKIDTNLGIKEPYHGVQTGKMMVKLEPIIQASKFDHCIVFGDTNSTIAGAIVAKKLKISTSHIEAGIRMNDLNMAEELNRRITDSIANYLFAPSQVAVQNLQREHVMGEIVFSGDIMYDSILMFQPKMKENAYVKKNLSNSEEFLLMTLHRSENVDIESILKETFANLAKLNLRVLFPCHPRTRKNLTLFNVNIPKNVLIIDPVSYLELLYLVKRSKLVITDSGGLQKEAFYLGKRSIVIFPETPWPELEKVNGVVLANPGNVDQIISKWIDKPLTSSIHPYGKGNATEIILKTILN